MKILVTGGAGFIGSEFVRQAVKQNHNVCVVDALTYAGDTERLKEVEHYITFYHADIRDYEEMDSIFAKEKPEAVVHFAAESHVDRSILEPRGFLQTNIEGTFNLLELSKKYGVERFINISTDEVYGELGEEGKFTEETPLKPNSPYSVSKASQDMLGRAYYRTYGLPVITVRPSNNYGPWQYPEKLIPVVIVKALKNQPIPVYGTGKNVREWLYVSDCAEAVLTILEKGKIGEVYNVSSSEERRNIEVVKAILDILGKPHNLIEFVKDRPGHDYRYSTDSQKIYRELGWKAKTKFEEGLEKTVKWYLDHQDWLEKKVKDLEEFWQKVYRK
ncbi:dTDP-glucose 4,6-dehydratase [Thermodesulfovibrio sp. 3462-1]|uniref:dTDP-glucose 4,6-dehydratase n=1 Tax=Thermodesulfovibrio obliviosus TaxID=3118332 RepID=A0AAU8H2X3_9BACT